MHIAAHNRQPDIIEELLAHNAPADAKDAQGAVPLHVAVQSGDVDTVAALLGRGNKVPELVILPLHGGCSCGHPIAVCRQPERTGLWDHVSRGTASYTGMMNLTGTQQYHGSARLLQVAVKYKNNLGYTPLHLAAKLGNLPVCEVLLGAGARADLKDQVCCYTAVQPCMQMFVLLARRS